MIRFEHVTKRYEDKDALSDLNLEIRDGETFWFDRSQWGW